MTLDFFLCARTSAETLNIHVQSVKFGSNVEVLQLDNMDKKSGFFFEETNMMTALD